LLRQHYTSFIARTNPSATPKGPACPSRDSGWLVTHQPPNGASRVATISLCTHAAATTPVEPLGVRFAHSPSDSSLPRGNVGSASTLSFFGACSAIHCTLQPAGSRGHLRDPFHRRLQPFRYLHDCSDCYRLERKFAGWVCLPLGDRAFPRRTFPAGTGSGFAKWRKWRCEPADPRMDYGRGDSWRCKKGSPSHGA